jgi:hypothetical protein
MPPSYWVEALSTATPLINILPTKTLGFSTPHLALLGTPPAYEHLRVFGCKCYPNLSATATHKRHPLRLLHPRHARPRPLRPPPSATSRPDSAAVGAACHLVLCRRSMSSRRSSRAGLALQRRQLLHLRRHRCLRVPSPCPPSSTSTP